MGLNLLTSRKIFFVLFLDLRVAVLCRRRRRRGGQHCGRSEVQQRHLLLQSCRRRPLQHRVDRNARFVVGRRRSVETVVLHASKMDRLRDAKVNIINVTIGSE